MLSSNFCFFWYIQLGIFLGAPNNGTSLPISFPYHSHCSRDSYGSGIGVVWGWGSHYWGSLEFPLIQSLKIKCWLFFFQQILPSTLRIWSISHLCGPLFRIIFSHMAGDSIFFDFVQLRMDGSQLAWFESWKTCRGKLRRCYGVMWMCNAPWIDLHCVRFLHPKGNVSTVNILYIWSVWAKWQFLFLFFFLGSFWWLHVTWWFDAHQYLREVFFVLTSHIDVNCLAMCWDEHRETCQMVKCLKSSPETAGLLKKFYPP